MSRKHARLTALRSPLKQLDLRSAKPAPKRADDFYLSTEWRQLIGSIIEERGRHCQACGRVGCRIFGDHVVELQDGGAPLDRSNVNLLCQSCHSKKTIKARANRMASTPMSEPRA